MAAPAFFGSGLFTCQTLLNISTLNSHFSLYTTVSVKDLVSTDAVRIAANQKHLSGQGRVLVLSSFYQYGSLLLCDKHCWIVFHSSRLCLSVQGHLLSFTDNFTHYDQRRASKILTCQQRSNIVDTAHTHLLGN